MNSLFKVCAFLLLAGMILALPAQAAVVLWTGATGDQLTDITKWTPNFPVDTDSPALGNGTTAELTTPFTPVVGTVYIGYNDTLGYAGNGGINVSGTGALTSTGSVVLGYNGYTGSVNMTGGSITGGSYLYVGYTTATTSPQASGTYTQSGGTASYGNTVRIGYQAATGSVALSGGSLSTLGAYVVGYSSQGATGSTSTQTGGTLNIGDGFFVGYGKASTASMSGGVINYVNAATDYDGWIQIGRSGVAGISQFDFSGGVINKIKGSGRVSIGESAATGIMNISGTAVMNTNHDAFIGVLGAAGASGTVNMSGNAVWNHKNGAMIYGYGTSGDTSPAPGMGVGALNMTGNAALNLRGVTMTLGIWRSSQGTMTMTDNTSLLMRNASLVLGDDWKAVGVDTFPMSTGTLTLTGNARADVASYVRVGNLAYGRGTVNMGTLGSLTDNPTFIHKVYGQIGLASATGAQYGQIVIGYGGSAGVWNQNAGTTLSTGEIYLLVSTGTSTNASATLNLNGGTFSAPSINTYSVGNYQPATINFDGGTLRAVWNNSNWIANGGNATLNLYVKAGGAVIDSNSYTVTIDQALQTDAVSLGGGLRKLNHGTLRLSAGNSYTGPTVVEGGTLRIIGPAGTLASSGITVKNGASLGGAALALALPAVTVETGGTIAPGDGAYGTLRLSTLSIQDKARFLFKNDATGGTGSDLLLLDSAPTNVSGSGVVDFVTNTSDPAFYYTGSPVDLMSWATGLGEIAPTLMPGVDSIGTSTYGLTYTAGIVGDPFTPSKVQATFAAITNEWNNGSGGAYGNVANWTTSVPGANQQALFGNFGGAIGGSVVDLQANVDVGTVIFNNATPYTLSDLGSAGSTLTLSTTIASEAQITVVTGNHVVNVPVVLGQNTRINVFDPAGDDSNSLTLNGVVSGAGGLGLLEGGKLVLANTANTYTGPTVMYGGTLEVTNLADGAPSSLGAWNAVTSLDPSQLALNGTLRYAGGASVTTQRGITISGGLTIESTQDITLSGKINGIGTGVVYKTGTGKLTFNYPGVQTLNHSDIRLVEGSMVFDGGAGAVYKLESDLSAISAWLVAGDNATTTDTTMEIKSGTIDINGYIYVGKGITTGNTSTLKMTGDSKIDAHFMSLGYYGGATGFNSKPVLEMSGNSEINLSTRADVGSMWIGDNPGADATLTMSGNAKIEALSYVKFAANTGTKATVTMSENSQLILDRNWFDVGVYGETTFMLKDNAKVVMTSTLETNVAVAGDAVTTVNLQNNASFDVGIFYVGRWDNAVGTINQTGGTLQSVNTGSRTWIIGGDGSATAKGYYNLSGGSVDSWYDGVQVGGAGVGVLNQTGGSLRFGGRTWVGTAATGIGAINISAGEAQFREYLVVGTAGLGVVKQTGGTATVTSYSYYGDAAASYGQLKLSGGTLNLNGAYNYIGNAGYGLFEQTGGTLNLASGARLWLGAAATSFGVANFTGGPTVVSGTSTVSNVLGDIGAGVMNVSGTADISNVYRIYLAYQTNGRGILNLGVPNNAAAVDGTLATYVLEERTGQTNNVGIVNFHGGVLKAARANQGTWVRNMEMYVYSDGAVMDTAGFDMGDTTSMLLAPTGKGLTSVALDADPNNNGTGYVAPPLVQISGGSGSGATANAAIDVNGHITGITITNPGINYLATDVLTFTFLGGGGTAPLVSPVGAFTDNVSGGLTKRGLGTLTLSAGQTYTGNTFVNEGTLTFTTPLSTPTAAVSVAVGATLNAPSIVANSLNIGVPMQAAAAAVPEPGTLVLLLLAGAALAGAYLRRK
ncbi:MAG: autotransporter-associated beta strand repeat-containing protein [Pirellulales bacterium]|nr:autotransporter-associated beta strand repeat-containing protein [Pirellulales bacterium]